MIKKLSAKHCIPGPLHLLQLDSAQKRVGGQSQIALKLLHRAISRHGCMLQMATFRWSGCVLLVAVGLWSDSGPQRSRAARTRGPGRQRPANAPSSTSDRTCRARPNYDRDTGAVDSCSTGGVGTSRCHFGELDSSQDSSCRPPMRRSAAGALQRSASVLFAEARARPRDRPRQPCPASCARQSSSSAVRSRARRRRRAFNGSHQCRTRSVVRQD